MYAEFAKVAEHNHFSWNYGQPAPTAETISTVTNNNRMICFPCISPHPNIRHLWPNTNSGPDPLLMNAYNKINLAGSCILTSTEYAKELGVPENKWIYPLGGAGTQDSDSCRCLTPSYLWVCNIKADEYGYIVWERPNYYSSPSISRSLDACLEISGLTKEQIDVFDFYSYVNIQFSNSNLHLDHQNSCFPIVPKLACQHLGLPSTKSPKPITLLGGLTSFGGAGNNYSMHVSHTQVSERSNGNSTDFCAVSNSNGARAEERKWPAWLDSCEWRTINLSACCLSLHTSKTRWFRIPG